MPQRPPTSQEKLTELSKRLDDFDRQKREHPARPKPRPVVGPNAGMSKVALVLWLCFVWACILGVIILHIAAITGVMGFKGPLPTWGEVVEQVLVGLLFSAGLITFYKFLNRTPRAPRLNALRLQRVGSGASPKDGSGPQHHATVAISRSGGSRLLGFITTAIRASFVLTANLIVALILLSGSGIMVKLVNLLFCSAVLAAIYAFNMYAWNSFVDRLGRQQADSGKGG